MRSLTLPTAVKAEQIEAKHEDGVLTVRLPKMEEDKPKKIAVKTMTNGNGKKIRVRPARHLPFLITVGAGSASRNRPEGRRALRVFPSKESKDGYKTSVDPD
jgi:hypothetical protein